MKGGDVGIKQQGQPLQYLLHLGDAQWGFGLLQGCRHYIIQAACNSTDARCKLLLRGDSGGNRQHHVDQSLSTFCFVSLKLIRAVNRHWMESQPRLSTCIAEWLSATKSARACWPYVCCLKLLLTVQ